MNRDKMSFPSAPKGRDLAIGGNAFIGNLFFGCFLVTALAPSSLFAVESIQNFTAPDTFRISLPIDSTDTTNNAYGLWPFGVHGGDHARDGHPGWDIEFKIGGKVRAAADGRLEFFSDSHSPDKYTVQIFHEFGNLRYRTNYTNISGLEPGITKGMMIKEGQVFGTAGAQTLAIGQKSVTFAMVHFQLDDFNRKGEGLTNPNAVSPELYLEPESKSLVEKIWKSANYNAELCEPFLTNPRNISFPVTRIWKLQKGKHAARIDFVRESGTSNDFDYAFYSKDGKLLEKGIAIVTPGAPWSKIELCSGEASSCRNGIYDIVGDTMRLDYGSVGAPAPLDLKRASVYKTE